VEELLRGGQDIEYLHVAARGRFHHDKERYLYAPGKATLGWLVYTPLEVAPARFVWVNRGWVPDERKAPARRVEGQMQADVDVIGLARLSKKPGPLVPANDVLHNLWYWPDISAMSVSAFGAATTQAAPFLIDVDAKPSPPGGLPAGGTTRLTLPNRHLEYALTWYGLALTLIGVYLAFCVAVARAARPDRARPS
jgi:surfeit locus 1 family protein